MTNQKNAVTKNTKPKLCNYCNKKGHLREQCYNLNENNKTSNSISLTQDLAKIKVTLDNKSFDALMDTIPGADIILSDIVNSLNPKPYTIEGVGFTVVNWNSMKCNKSLDYRRKFPTLGIAEDINFEVLENISRNITIGHNALKKLGITL